MQRFFQTRNKQSKYQGTGGIEIVGCEVNRPLFAGSRFLTDSFSSPLQDPELYLDECNS